MCQNTPLVPHSSDPRPLDPIREVTSNLDDDLNELWGRISFHFEREFDRPINDRGVVAACRELWSVFNTERSKLTSQLLNQPKMASSYALLFWIPNVLRALRVFSELPPNALKRPKQRWLDVGCGPFSASTALLLWNFQQSESLESIQMIGLDHCTRLPQFARNVLLDWVASKAPRLDLSIRVLKSDLRKAWSQSNAHVVMASNLLNELKTTERLSEYLQRSRNTPADMVMLMEPAKAPSFQQLLVARESLLAHGYLVQAPCTHQLACPLKDRKIDRCFTETELSPNLLWAQWSRRFFKNQLDRTLNLSYVLASSKLESPASDTAARVVSAVVPTPQGKGHYLCRNGNITWEPIRGFQRGERIP